MKSDCGVDIRGRKERKKRKSVFAALRGIPMVRNLGTSARRALIFISSLLMMTNGRRERRREKKRECEGEGGKQTEANKLIWT